MLHPGDDDGRRQLEKLGRAILRQRSLVPLLLLALRPALLPPSRAPVSFSTGTRGALVNKLRLSSPRLGLTGTRGELVDALRLGSPRLGPLDSSSNEGNNKNNEAAFKITIRDVRPHTDLQDVSAFLTENYVERDFFQRFSDSGFSVQQLAHGLSVVILAEENGAIVGSLGLTVAGLSPRKKTSRRLDNETDAPSLLGMDSFAFYQELVSDDERVSPQVWNLAVRKGERRRGLARKLLSFTEEKLEASGYPDVHLLVRADNSQASRLYNSSGYHLEWTKTMGVMEKTLWISSVERVNVFCMCKNLSTVTGKRDAQGRRVFNATLVNS